MKTGTELIAEERHRQIEKEGWTSQHDDKHNDGDLAAAGGCYAITTFNNTIDPRIMPPQWWPFEERWWKPTPDNKIKQLQKAGALIAAEIDRLNRDD